MKNFVGWTNASGNDLLFLPNSQLRHLDNLFDQNSCSGVVLMLMLLLLMLAFNAHHVSPMKRSIALGVFVYCNTFVLRESGNP